MEIFFADDDLELCAVDQGFALKKLGAIRAKLYARRIRSMQIVQNFERLKFQPGNFHELVGNRKGQWACNLDQPYRLVSKGAEPDENVVWSDVSRATVLEVVDYHK